MIPSTFADVLREKICTRASFIKILANYISEERAAFLLRKCQEPVIYRVPVAFSKDFFSLLDRMVLSFFFVLVFFVFFPSTFDFSTSKDFSKEIPRVNFVKCTM